MSTHNTMSAAAAAVATNKERNRDIPLDVLIGMQAKIHKEGGTIDDLITLLEKVTGITGIKKPSLNVRRSQAKAAYAGKKAAQRSDLMKALSEEIERNGEASEQANNVRESIRKHDKTTAAMLATWSLTRSGRSGGVPSSSLVDTVENAIADAVLDDIDVE